MAQIDITTTRTRVYKDLSLTFALNPITNDVMTVIGDDAVKRSIKNIIMTQAGEVPFFPRFGSRLNALLFDPIDPITTALISSEVEATITGFEPRVKILDLVVTPSEDEHQYQVTLTLQLLNQIEPITFTLFLTRLR